MSKILRPVVISLVALVALLIAFQAGRFVGERRAMYSFRWSQNYHQMFAGPQHGLFGAVQDQSFMDAHGMFGTVLKIDGNSVIIRDKDDTEKTVVVSTSTVIRRNADSIAPTDMTDSDHIVIIGEPEDDGQIDAKFIRVLPPMPPAPPDGF